MNSNIDYLKQLNIKFEIINEIKAQELIDCNFPCSLLLSYSSIFEKYRIKEKEGKFVNLDFAQLFYLALIDEQLRQFLMILCLEIELKIKTILIADAQKLNVEEVFLQDYINSDIDYLTKTYPNEINDFNLCPNEDLSPLYNFTSAVLFGTFEKLVHNFYCKYAELIYGKQRAPFEKYLSSVRRIRNMVAHNSPLLSELSVNNKMSNNSLSPFLSDKGIKSKTLHTNLSKPIIFDICNIMRLYCGIQSVDKINKTNKEFKKFLRINYRKYGKYLKTNQTISSSYTFFKSIVKIFSSKVAI